MTISGLCYELYKIDWMQRISPERQMDNLKTYYEDAKEDTESTTYEEIIEEFGFDGELYVCFDEFLGAEYQDKEYMKELLDNNELYKEYLEDVKGNDC